MKLNEILNLNKPQLKISKISLRTKRSQSLIITNLTSEDCVGQVYSSIRKVIEKYINDDVAEYTVKLVDRQPIIFNLISPTADGYFQFIVEFPPDQAEAQKGLITAIGNAFDTLVH